MDKTLAVDERVELLAQALTLNECIGQLQQNMLGELQDSDIREGLGSVI